MHLEWYTGNVVELYLYSKYFWYLEISRVTIILGAYLGDELVGVLLTELEKQEVGKEIYLYTDSGSTYQFYEHRGFKVVGQKDIKSDIHREMVSLMCMLFAKILGSR